MLTTYIDVKFNKMLETLTFQQSYARHLYSIKTNIVVKSGDGYGEHYF